MAPSRRVTLLLGGAIVLSSCAGTTTVATTTSIAPTPSMWRACGSIQCASVDVPVDHDMPTGATFALSLFANAPVESGSDPLFMVADLHHGDDPREVVEYAKAHLGGDWAARMLMSIDVRGSVSSPLPARSERFVAVRDIARDIDFVRRTIGLGSVDLIGWGRGATAVAALVAENPEAASRVVLDSPGDPFLPSAEQVRVQIAADAEMVDHALTWCVSHISCPMSDNAAKGFNLLRTNMRIGIVDERVSMATVGLAARRAFAVGDPQGFFTSVVEATAGDATALWELATAQQSMWQSGEVCADLTIGEAVEASSLWRKAAAAQGALFVLGGSPEVLDACGAVLTGAPRAVRPVVADGADQGNVLVVHAQHDPITASSLPRSLVQRFGWDIVEMPLWRHLVVGIDAETTSRVLEFLNS